MNSCINWVSPSNARSFFDEWLESMGEHPGVLMTQVQENHMGGVGGMLHG